LCKVPVGDWGLQNIVDKFANTAEKFIGDELVYSEDHPDFVAAYDLGKRIARLWALKLKMDFPSYRFRVYYTQCDNPIVRFHKVRDGEACWLSDEVFQSATDPSFRNAMIFDTANIHLMSSLTSDSIQ